MMSLALIAGASKIFSGTLAFLKVGSLILIINQVFNLLKTQIINY